jgi:dienelactone hydrolase
MPRTSVALALAALAGCVAVPSGPPVGAASPSAAEPISVSLFKPDGPGTFPAVVIMHDCSGLGPRSSGAPVRWAKELSARGYVAVVPDSFTARGHAGGICTVPLSQRASDVTPQRRAQDAYWALAYLRTLPFVDGERVMLLGGSHGGTTTLSAMVQAPDSSGARPGFAAAVAFYPRCASPLGSWRPDLTGVYHPVAPVLILIGEKDDWTPAGHCEKLAQSAREAGQPVSIKVYPGAHHSFDSAQPVRYLATRINTNVPGGRGATTGGNAVAWADSIREVVSFFEHPSGARASKP